MLAYWVGYGFTELDSPWGWRVAVALQACFQIPMAVLCLLVPESPRWLASHNKSAESLSVIARLAGRAEDDPDVQALHSEICTVVEFERSIGSGTWSDLVKSDAIHSRRRFLIACSIQFFQQAGGINALIY
jgi:hypothetical protein